MLGLTNKITRYKKISAAYNKFALSFDGTDDYVDTNASFQATFRNSFTVSCWQNSSTYNSSDVLWGVADTANNDFIKLFQRGTHNKICFQFKSDGANHRKNENVASFDASSGLDGAWVNWVVTVTKPETGTDKIITQIYKNGAARAHAADSSFQDANTGDDMAATDIDQDLYIGSFHANTGSNTNDIDCLIDEWAIWNTALDADAVAAIYNSGVPFNLKSDKGNYDNSSNLVAYYNFNEGSGTTATDLTGGSNGTINNATYSTNAPGV